MSLAINKILFASNPFAVDSVPTNTAGAYWQTSNVVVNTAGANLNIVIAAGLYYANTPSNCAFYANLGASNVQVLGANTCGLLWSDGLNCFANTTTNGNVIMVTVNSGQAASGTFTS